jgi:hypothetical protein
LEPFLIPTLQLKNMTMNKIIKGLSARILFVFLFMVGSVITFAQDKGLDVDINVKKESDWYQQPWVWIVGGAVFILLLAAILRGNSRKNA